MKTRTTTWLPDDRDGIAVLAYGPTPLLDFLAKLAHRTSVNKTSQGRMLWLSGASIDAGFELMRSAAIQGDMRIHPPIGDAVVVQLRDIPPVVVGMEEK